ncbi:MAG: hypothetical protein NPIRA05_05890 [Nitrospirales bacterium]|nr:MAG: hypothetical protein NPIRA05_05890 [Nitrospirales bacterium]GJL70109.1 MAG: hypothetical protein NPIRA06_27440 [Nitrospirales bacterium]
MSNNLNNMSDFDLVNPDSIDPVLSQAFKKDIRVPNSNPVKNKKPNLHVGKLKTTAFEKARSMRGFPITGNIRSSWDDLELALENLDRAARMAGHQPLTDLTAAKEAWAILRGTTQGKVYDGFPLLNYNFAHTKYSDINKGKGLTPDHVPGEYKMKRLKDTGKTVKSLIDGKQHKIWDVTINMLWTGQNFDSDTFLLRVPKQAHNYDEFQINWRVYSMIQEDLAPTTVLNDAAGRIFHGLDSTFLSMTNGSLNEITIKYPSIINFRGLYNWGWGAHPPRIQFLQPVREQEAKQGGKNGWDPFSYSFVTRNREDQTIENIGMASPEKKAYWVAEQALNGTTGSEIARMLNERNTTPRGVFHEWVALSRNQRQLPPEAWETIKDMPGVIPEDRRIGPFDAVLAFVNNKLYGITRGGQPNTDGKSDVINDFQQGDVTKVKVINLDRHTHYYRNVDFGARYTDDIKKTFGNGKFSFDKMNTKPNYGVPKVIEMQWRTGWGYVPHRGIAKQGGVFPRIVDRLHLTPFLDQFGEKHVGYIFKHNVSGYWRFDPPEPIRAGSPEGEDPINPDRDPIDAGDPLKDEDGRDGVLMGFNTEAFGVAKMPEEELTHHPNQEGFPTQQFPGFLRNPDPNGGDLIPPTPAWKPYIALNPATGELEDDGGYWVDKTYLHGRPVKGHSSIEANIEAPRASAQLFYNFDPCFHDNAIFSWHPSSDAAR